MPLRKSCLRKGVPAVADDLPEVTVGFGLANGQCTLHLKAQPGGCAVSRAEVNDEIVKRLAKIALLQSHARDRAVLNTGRVALLKKGDQLGGCNSVFECEACTAGEFRRLRHRHHPGRANWARGCLCVLLQPNCGLPQLLGGSAPRDE